MRTCRSWPPAWPLGRAGLLAVSLFAVGVGGWPAPARADAATDPLFVETELGPPSPHWVLYTLLDAGIESSRYVLFDADTAQYKAHIATGLIPSLQQSPDGRELYVADTFLNGPERWRQDVISIYDTRDYSLSGTIDLPKKRRALVGPQARTALISGRFLVVFNFSPATGISVIDTEKRSIVSEIETPGCFLLYPTGARGVSMLCGDGSVLTLQLDAEGQLAKRIQSAPFFDPDVDPIIENGAKLGGTWYFPSYSGDVYPVDLSGAEPVFLEPWSLVDRDKKPAGRLMKFLSRGRAGPWRPGGGQLIAAHDGRGELYVLMHPLLGEGDHVSPGLEVWVYDAAAKARTRRLALQGAGIAVYVTADEEPLMLVSGMNLEWLRTEASAAPAAALEVYDAETGEFLRQLTDVGIAVQFEAAPGSGGAR